MPQSYTPSPPTASKTPADMPPPGVPPPAPPPGAGIPSWVRWLPLIFVPLIGIMVVSVLLDQPKPLAPECAAALRCCLAAANVSPPVAIDPLRRCTKMAKGPKSSCSDALSEARRAGVDCQASPVRQYGSYRWTEQASTKHAAPGQRAPRKELYPRLSCREAASSLARAVREKKDGAWVAARPLDLMIVALRLDDPAAVIYYHSNRRSAHTPRQSRSCHRGTLASLRTGSRLRATCAWSGPASSWISQPRNPRNQRALQAVASK